MQLVLLGAPGSGKGTMAADLCKHFDIPHISTGDILRANIRGQTKLGVKARAYIDAGALVPDYLTIPMVASRLAEPDSISGFLLDGFPRTLNQAEALAQMKATMERPLSAVINIQTSDQTILRRLAGRRLCPNCGRGYNVSSSPSMRPKVDTLCDDCHEELIQRADDKPETVQARLETYHKQTEPLILYYRQRGILLDVDNEGTPEESFAEALRLLGSL